LQRLIHDDAAAAFTRSSQYHGGKSFLKPQNNNERPDNPTEKPSKSSSHTFVPREASSRTLTRRKVMKPLCAVVPTGTRSSIDYFGSPKPTA
jgi:hypothetical protein